MAYITRHPKSKYWQAGFRDAAGRKCSRSTGIQANPTGATPKESAALTREARQRAQFIADTFERAARGELMRESMVRKTLLEIVEAVRGPHIEKESTEDFFFKWIEDAEREGKSSTTLSRYKQIQRDFLDSLGDRRRVPIEEICPSDIKAYIDTLSTRGLASKTLSNTIKILRIPFAEANRLGKLTTNPALAIKPPTVISVERKPFSPEELKKILEATTEIDHSSDWRTAIMLGYYCGMRLGDATGLDWKSVDKSRRCITFIPEKTKRGRKVVEIPLHPCLEEYLQSIAMPAANSKQLLTPNLMTPAGKRGWLSRQFAQLIKIAGVENSFARTTKADGGGRRVPLKSFHALRHSLASHLAAAGVSAEIRMKFTGHSSLAVHAGYTHTELSTLREALEKLPG